MIHRPLLFGVLIALAASSCKSKGADAGSDAAAPDPAGSAATAGNESEVVDVPEPPPPQDETPPPAPTPASVWYHGYWNLDPETKAYVWQAGYWQDPNPAAANAPTIPPPPPRVETVAAPPWPGYTWNGGYWRWSATHEYVWAPGHWGFGGDAHAAIPPPPPRWEQVSGHWVFRDDARTVREENWNRWQAQRDAIRERETRALVVHPVYGRVYVHTALGRPDGHIEEPRRDEPHGEIRIEHGGPGDHPPMPDHREPGHPGPDDHHPGPGPGGPPHPMSPPSLHGEHGEKRP